MAARVGDGLADRLDVPRRGRTSLRRRARRAAHRGSACSPSLETTSAAARAATKRSSSGTRCGALPPRERHRDRAAVRRRPDRSRGRRARWASRSVPRRRRSPPPAARLALTLHDEDDEPEPARWLNSTTASQLPSAGSADTPLAEPEPVRRRCASARAGTGTRRVLATTTACAVACRGAGRRADRDATTVTTRRTTCACSRPTSLLGDIDAVVLSNDLRRERRARPHPDVGARPVGDDSGRPGSERHRAALRPDRRPVMSRRRSAPPQTGPPRTPVLFSYHEGSEVSLVSRRAADPRRRSSSIDARSRRPHRRVGRRPRDARSRLRRAPGEPAIGVRGPSAASSTCPVSTLTGVPLAAVPATQPLEDGTFDRIDRRRSTRAPTSTAVRAAVASVLGDAYVTLTADATRPRRPARRRDRHPARVLGAAEPERRGAVRRRGSPTARRASRRTRATRGTRTLADQAELRIESVDFVAADRGERRVPHLLRRRAVTDHHRPADRRGSPRRRASGASPRPRLCQLAAYVGQQCAASPTSRCNRPTAGARSDTRDPEIAAPFRVARRPGRDRRRAGCRDRHIADARPDQQRLAIAAGVAQDRQYSGRTKFLVIGVRDLGDHARGALQPHSRRRRRAQHAVPGHRQRAARRPASGWSTRSTCAASSGLAQQGCPEAERGAGTEPRRRSARRAGVYERAGNEALAS